MTHGEKLAHVRNTVTPYAGYYGRAYTKDVLKILANRGIKDPETGEDFTLLQIQRTKSGRLPHPLLADIIAEVGRRNKEALEKTEAKEGGSV